MMAAEQLQSHWTLAELLHGLVATGSNDAAVAVTGLCIDSRKLQPGDLFIARSGSQQHAARFIPDAIAAGACAVIMEPMPGVQVPSVSVPVYTLTDFNQQLGQLAARFFSTDTLSIPLVGITGTNGKTSISWILAHAYSEPNKSAAMIGTLGIGPIDDLHESVNTTPDVITVHGSVARLRDIGATAIAMEVSSHALQQQRIAGLRFSQALFTNLTHEHLDYHVTMQAYGAAKRRLFTDYPVKGRIVNIDDEFGKQLWQSFDSNNADYAYTLSSDFPNRSDSIVKSRLVKNDLDGIQLHITSCWGEHEIHSRLSGGFNASNLTAGFISLCASGIDADDAAARLAACPPIPGRMERFGNKNTPCVIVDYAHTADALENVLKSLKPQCRGRLICIFGCGGDRDTGKRAAMGQVADHYADDIVVTNDNPRNEDPESIIEQILSGIQRRNRVLIEPDRSVAITSAIRQAGKEDIVLVAGKGHETSQLIMGEYLPFSDRNLVRACLEAW